MPRTRKGSIPSYRLHKKTGQAIVTVMQDGKRHDVYLGVYGSEESKQRYVNAVAGRPLDAPPTPALEVEAPPKPRHELLTVRELWKRFEPWAVDYYRGHTNESRDVDNYKHALAQLLSMHGDRPSWTYDRVQLREVRDAMVAKGLARGTVNSRVCRIVRVFKWATDEEHRYVPDDVASGLGMLAPLKRLRTSARETDKVTAVPMGDVVATLKHLNPTVAGMVKMQLYTGMRPGEVMSLTAEMIDGDVIDFGHRHKTGHHGHARRIVMGPQAKAIVEPLVARGGLLFRPRDATPPRRKINPRVGLRYTRWSYNQAIERGCNRANVEVWSANQLRHLYATLVRDRFGLEGAQVALGHERADVTEIYAERNQSLAAKIARELG